MQNNFMTSVSGISTSRASQDNQGKDSVRSLMQTQFENLNSFQVKEIEPFHVEGIKTEVFLQKHSSQKSSNIKVIHEKALSAVKSYKEKEAELLEIIGEIRDKKIYRYYDCTS